MQKSLVIGQSEGKDIHLDIAKLIDTRLLVQANSGGGKSWLIRRLLEQSHGKVQQIVIDLEGEFSTLREKGDYIVAGKGAEVEADPKSAGLLARRLLELGVSAIIDLYELHHQDRKRFVRLFLEAMINAPKDLWHPVVVVIDEAHVFCPEKGEAESAEAVKDLCTRGRKRGFCAVLATQRLSKLHKDAAAECNNKLIGRTGMDIDMKRAYDELGFTTKEQFHSLRKLEAGQFFAYGTAISQEVVAVKVGEIETTHPKAGHRADFKAAKPTAKIREILGKLGDLQQEAQEEEDVKTKLMQSVYDLTRENRGLKAHKCAGVSQEDIDKAVAETEAVLTRKHRQEMGVAIDMLKEIGANCEKGIERLDVMLDKPFRIYRGINAVPGALEPGKVVKPVPMPDVEFPKLKRAFFPMHGEEFREDANLPKKLTGGALRMVGVLVARSPKEVTLTQLATLSGMSPTSGTFRTYLGAIRTAGMIEDAGNDSFRASSRALEVAGDAPALSHADLIAMWRKTLSGGALRMFDRLLEIYPADISLEELATQCGMEASSGTFRTYLGKLRSNQLVKMSGKDRLHISEELGERD